MNEIEKKESIKKICRRTMEEIERIAGYRKITERQFAICEGIGYKIMRKWEKSLLVPDVKSLEKLYYAGADVLYIIFGERV